MVRPTVLHVGKLPRRYIIHTWARVVSGAATDEVNISVLVRCAPRGRHNETPRPILRLRYSDRVETHLLLLSVGELDRSHELAFPTGTF